MRRIRNILKRVIVAHRPGQATADNHPEEARFTSHMTIDEAWNKHPEAPEVFRQFHLPSCSGCSVRFDERVSEATEAYGIDLEEFLCALNALQS